MIDKTYSPQDASNILIGGIMIGAWGVVLLIGLGRAAMWLLEKLHDRLTGGQRP